VAAAFAVRKAHHPIDAGGQHASAIVLRHQLHHVRRTIRRGRHGDVIARSDAPVGARISHKRRRIFWNWRQHPLIRRKFVLPLALVKRQIMHVHVPAGLNCAFRPSNHLAVAPHFCARLNRAQCHFVPDRDPIEHRHRHASGRNHLARPQRRTRDRDRIVRMQVQRRRTVQNGKLLHFNAPSAYYNVNYAPKRIDSGVLYTSIEGGS
jgi:hypothetical protein